MAGDEKNAPDPEEARLSPKNEGLTPAESGGSEPGSSTDVNESTTAAPETSSAAPATQEVLEDELPEFEPLTPELVEEEAIRGDFMLRWAAIFLALLFGFSKLTDTRTLVHIRSGEYMRSHGFLPPRVDTMSFSADGQPVSNVSWLFDHLISLVWSIGGENMLTIFKALVAAAIARVLVGISVSGVATWWNSICAVFAIVACSGDFVALSELMTLLGMVLVLKMLHQYREGTAGGLMWKMPLLIVVWCNLDPRAWIGTLSVILFALGSTIAGRRQAQTGEAPVSDLPQQPQQNLWPVAALCTVALLLNPFPLNSLLSPMSLYSVEYPAMQDQRPLNSPLARVSFDGRVDYFPMWSPDAFLLFDHTQIAGLSVILVAFVVIILSRNSRDTGYLALLCGLTFLSLLAVHELPAAAMAAAVIAGTTAQRWYRANYQMAYSTDVRELLFSRGGRAVTVFAFAFLGFCVVAGRLPGSTPVGLGFETDTRTTIDTLGQQLDEAGLAPDAHILHTRIDQGDILIWHGRKSMIDSRMQPFGRPGNPTGVFARHKVILTDLLTPTEVAPPVGGDPVEAENLKKRRAEIRQGAVQFLQELAISHVMPRLSPPGDPDYRSLLALLNSPEWLLISLGPSAAIVERIPVDLSNEQKLKKVPRFTHMAFQDAKPAAVNRGDFSREPSFYERFVYRERPTRDEHLRMAEHYLFISGSQPRSTDQLFMYLSMATMGLRHLNQSLYLNPQNEEALQLLGIAYKQIDIFETMISNQAPQPGRQQMRYLQSVMALHQSLTRMPDDSGTLLELFQQYDRQGKIDLAAECLDRWMPLQEDSINDSRVEEQVKELSDVQRQLQEAMTESEQRLEQELQKLTELQEPTEKGSLVLSLASSLAQSGLSKRALQLMKDHESVLLSSPIARVLQGQLMLECGEIEQGYTILNQIAAVARDQTAEFGAGRWHLPAALSQLSIADYASAIDYWTLQLEELDTAANAPEATQDLMLTLPLVAENALLPDAMLPQWPVSHMSAMLLPAQGISSARAEVRFLIALCHIEEGNLPSARLILQAIIAECGASPYRQLAAQYLLLMDDQAADFINRHSLDEWEAFEFPGEAQTQVTPENSAPLRPPLAP